jgi:hypothetical protein
MCFPARVVALALLLDTAWLVTMDRFPGPGLF